MPQSSTFAACAGHTGRTVHRPSFTWKNLRPSRSPLPSATVAPGGLLKILETTDYREPGRRKTIAALAPIRARP